MVALRPLLLLTFTVLIFPLLSISGHNDTVISPQQTNSSTIESPIETTIATRIAQTELVSRSYVPDTASVSNLDITILLHPLVYISLLVWFYILNRENSQKKEEKLTASIKKFRLFLDLEYLLTNNRRLILILEGFRLIFLIILAVLLILSSPSEPWFYFTFLAIASFSMIGKIIEGMRNRISSIENQVIPLRDHLLTLEQD